jgi:SWI/SNF-related matrix-associated actin-dependent regulator 1 of chromatin subfamily A
MPAVKEWSKDFLASGEKLCLFGWHREIVDGLTEALNAVKVQGGQSDAVRNQSVDLFQTKPEVKVFVGQIMAAGEGITLTAASNLVLTEQAWNQAAHDQVLDRLHRRGQVNDVMGYVVLIEDTIGVDIQQLIKAKQKEVEAVVDGQTITGSGSILPDLVVRLAGRGM